MVGVKLEMSTGWGLLGAQLAEIDDEEEEAQSRLKMSATARMHVNMMRRRLFILFS